MGRRETGVRNSGLKDLHSKQKEACGTGSSQRDEHYLWRAELAGPGAASLVRAKVFNSWQLSSPADTVGYELEGLSKVSRIKKPVDTIYMADNEYGSWRPIISDLGFTISDEENDVWQPGHLPYAPDGRTINTQRRVALARHGNGSNVLYFDGHSAWKKARLIIVNDWREDKN